MGYEGEETGDARVDEATAGLDHLGELPLDQHVAVFEDTHARLRQVLSDLDADQDGQGQNGQGQDGQGQDG
ncbi:MAG TPA: hypothetical protein VHY58_19785 [Streptosporangiaceae bacterium]|jgi:hypothetical protein|nr:hypothetical protein [Streptosporangiaceae bacterium]